MRVRGRRLLGGLFHALVLAPALLALAVLGVLLVSVVSDSVSWVVVKPAGSGQSFSFTSGFKGAGTWRRVVELELAARGAPSASSALNNAEERRKFAARNRVRLLLADGDRPLRWVVSTTEDERVRVVPLLEGLRERRALEASLAPGERLYLVPWLNWGFVTRNASRSPLMAGVLPALVGSAWVSLLVLLISVPLGVGAAVYLEEYARESWLKAVLEVNLRNLAGVPSIVYGLLGLALFVRLLRLGPVVLAAALTLSLLVVPVVVMAAREALKAVPVTLRQAAYGMGASRSQVTFRVVLPAALSGIMTGVILGVARAVGETAPLIVLGAFVFVPGVPKGPLSEFSVLPIQIYSWVSEAEPGFANAASAGIITLMGLIGVIYALAFYVRRKFERRA